LIKICRYIGLLLLTAPVLFASEPLLDSDLDGVEDRYDHCPNTPFDAIVDPQGCSQDSQTTRWLLQAGIDYSADEHYASSTLLNLYLSIFYQNWDLALSTTNQSRLNTQTTTEDDLYVTLGYTLPPLNHHTYLHLFTGTKFAFVTKGTRDNDYFLGADLSYAYTQATNLFAYYSYTLSGEGDGIAYRDFSTLSFGVGQQLSAQWYGSFNYTYVEATYVGAASSRSLSFSGRYIFKENLYLSMGYTYGLNRDNYDHTLSLAIGVNFE